MVTMNDEMKWQLLTIIGKEANIDVEIDQELYPCPDWAVSQIVRSSGLVEDISKTGCGHPNAGWLGIHDPTGELGYGLHCCDGACVPGMKEAIKKVYKDKEDQSSEPFQELWDENLRKRVMKEYDERSNTPSIESGRCDKT